MLIDLIYYLPFIMVLVLSALVFIWLYFDNKKTKFRSHHH